MASVEIEGEDGAVSLILDVFSSVIASGDGLATCRDMQAAALVLHLAPVLQEAAQSRGARKHGLAQLVTVFAPAAMVASSATSN